ncbi:MAG TPA: radical SAM family heme chaperone HemW [Opitutaceae bacterium]|jgi:oxygen-independent coproporphyrinogen-3 oxidase
MRVLATEEQAKAEGTAGLGLYVHVPFCASTCDFCAFYQVRPTRESVAGFMKTLGSEAALVDWGGPIATVFWGGGTPGLLAPDDLARLASLVRSVNRGPAPLEWTVELAPASVTRDRLDVLRAAGVTRISLGVQSLRPALLDALGRAHTREQVLRAYERIRDVGFASVNLDLMFALPGQGLADWEADLDEVIALGPDHLSTYCLTFEEDTRLWVQLSKGRIRVDAQNEADLYERTWERLASAGFAQYEISNFARPGHACRHNVATWRMGDWVGLGPSAASQHLGWRGSNIADLEAWASQVENGRRMTVDREALTQAAMAEDALVFGLRMNEGVDLEGLWRRLPQAPWQKIEPRIDRLVEGGIAVRDGTRVRLEGKGRLLADSVAQELALAFDRRIPAASA